MIRGLPFLTKKSATHAAFFGLMSVIVWQSSTTGVNRNSLLYSFISGEEVSEGPLDPSAYAQDSNGGTGGPRLAVVDASDVNLITFDDPEVQFAQTLGGTAVLAPNQPVVPEPGSDTSNKSKRPIIYTIAEDDTVASIAATFGISENTVLWANNLSSRDVLKVGDHLTILSTTGVLHTVQSGDTVLAIAQAYNVKGKNIAEYNGLEDSSKLSIGQKLIIPDGYISPRTTPQIVSGDTRLARDATDGPTPAPKESAGFGWVWPTTTRHIAQYMRWGHTGIDIDNRSRPPVYATQAGTVEFAGWLGGYGNLMIINHGNGMTSHYAHLDKFYASKGQSVSAGAAIAQMGSTGRSTGSHLHFEVRRGGRPIDPMSIF